MHPQDDGDFREEHTRSVLYCSPAPDQRVLDTLESRYRVTTVASPAAVPEQPDAHFDCLVLDGDLYNEVVSNYPHLIDWNLEWVLTFGGVPSENVTESTLTRLKTFAELLGHTLRRDRRLREIERQNERLERFAWVIRHDLHTLVHEVDDLGEREPVVLSTLVDCARSTVDMEDATVESADVGVIETDPGRLRQAFENLFRNAVEHGGSAVTVRITALENGFAIEDDGPGIPEPEREAVFEEGYSAGGDSGLGLSIVRTIIDAHGCPVRRRGPGDRHALIRLG